MAIIIPRESYAKAAGIGSSIFQIGLIAGPAIGGLLVGFASTTAAYIFSGIMCIGAMLALLSLRLKEPPFCRNRTCICQHWARFKVCVE